ncbi:MAG: DUF2147 domain-containing protein [Methyloceanibacter sp.]
MRHRVFAPALAVLIAAFAVAGMSTQARAADPSGIWAKDDGTAKLEIKKCGRGICSKIVWLRDPVDSRGKPLRDARNQNPSMRDRPIMGLGLFSNMVATEPNTWVGNVYNPEEGRVYTEVKVTLVSRQQLVLRGCRTWLLCGEKTWTRSKIAPAPAPAEPEELIEVKAPAEPEEPIKAKAPPVPEIAAPKPEPIVEAAREPETFRTAPSTLGHAIPAAVSEPRVSEAPKRVPAAPTLYKHTTIGLGFVVATTSQEPLPLSGDNVSSMMVMTRPAPTAAASKPRVTPPAVETALQEEAPRAPASAPKPRAKPRAAQAAQAASVPMAAAPAQKPKPKAKPVVQEEVLPWLQH